MKKERLLDLVVTKFNISQKEAIGLIMSGKVLIDEAPVTKIGAKVDINKKARIKFKDKYVSRGAHKLLTAFEIFSISVKDKICLDIGSSNGGFTQVLLEKGAKKIYAVDCGNNLLDYSLRNNLKVISIEDTNIYDLNSNDFNELVEFAVMDVSFTSSVNIIRHLFEALKIKEMVVLIKPQFEYKRLISKINLCEKFNGIVKNKSDRMKIIEFIKNEIRKIDLKVYNVIPSKIKGTKGNQEYLFYIMARKD